MKEGEVDTKQRFVQSFCTIIKEQKIRIFFLSCDRRFLFYLLATYYFQVQESLLWYL